MNETNQDPALIAQQFADAAEQSQRVIQAFWQRQIEEATESGFSLVDPKAVGAAFFDWSTKLMEDPGKLAETQIAFWHDQANIWQSMTERAWDKDATPAFEPEKGDRRFRDPAWDDELLYDYLKQSYLLSAKWMRSVAQETVASGTKDQERVDFYTRQFISAMSPSNFALTNPAVLKKAQETGGQNLVEGLKHLLADLEKGKGRLKISMTDETAFEVGKNVATTPGQVIFQNELMQLIQYAPTTDQVYKRPLLLVPPWINKFYILDLQPKNSFIKHAIDQGYTVFVISWANPNETLAQKDFEDYMKDGPIAALTAIEQATGEDEVNILGFCIGGILVSTALAYLAVTGQGRP